MEPIRFDPQSDLAPIPFRRRICRLAQDLKSAGLAWKPHVGCFVWDPEGRIEPASPFPERIYFVLSLPRFLSIFGSREAMARHLVWLPTWHQARLLCDALGVDRSKVGAVLTSTETAGPGAELEAVYGLLLHALAK